MCGNGGEFANSEVHVCEYFNINTQNSSAESHFLLIEMGVFGETQLMTSLI